MAFMERKKKERDRKRVGECAGLIGLAGKLGHTSYYAKTFPYPLLHPDIQLSISFAFKRSDGTTAVGLKTQACVFPCHSRSTQVSYEPVDFFMCFCIIEMAWQKHLAFRHYCFISVKKDPKCFLLCQLKLLLQMILVKLVLPLNGKLNVWLVYVGLFESCLRC